MDSALRWLVATSYTPLPELERLVLMFGSMLTFTSSQLYSNSTLTVRPEYSNLHQVIPITTITQEVRQLLEPFLVCRIEPLQIYTIDIDDSDYLNSKLNFSP